jgi:hypothetical protein
MTVSKFTAATQPPTWQVIYDVFTGRVTSNIYTMTEYRVDETTVIRRENSVVSQVDPADPAHASAHGRSIHHIIRPNHVTRGCSDLVIQATATHFHLTIDLDVQVNDAPHFHKRWVESVPRRYYRSKTVSTKMPGSEDIRAF